MTKTLYVPEHIKNRKTAPPPSKSDSLDEVYERIDKELYNMLKKELNRKLKGIYHE